MKKSSVEHRATFQLMPTLTRNKTQKHHLPSPLEVVAALEIGLRWIKSCDSNHIQVLQMANFVNIAMADQLASRKQKSYRLF